MAKTKKIVKIRPIDLDFLTTRNACEGQKQRFIRVFGIRAATEGVPFTAANLVKAYQKNLSVWFVIDNILNWRGMVRLWREIEDSPADKRREKYRIAVSYSRGKERTEAKAKLKLADATYHRVLHRIVMKLAQNKRNLNKGVYE